MFFENKDDYGRIDLEDMLEIKNFLVGIKARRVTVADVTKGFEFTAVLDLSDAELETVLDGGQLRHLKKQLQEMGMDTTHSFTEVRVEA